MTSTTATDDFAALCEPHRAALRLHCYRMAASLDDADDLLQETMLRAWQRLGSLRDREAARPWLYRIATNVCLDHLAKRKRRILPQDLTGANVGREQPPVTEIEWLEPLPSAWIETFPDPADPPDVQVERIESVRLAFIAALQHLPPRQRAALLLADVLGWRAKEIAEAIETTVPSVNSALQRARATLRGRLGGDEEPRTAALANDEQRVLARYVEYWEAGDLEAFGRLLADEAVLAMPPSPDWYLGRDAVMEFMRWAWGPEAGLGPFRLLQTSANGQPAIALYGRQGSDEAFAALALKVIDIENGRVRRITGFVAPKLFERFELPSAV